MKKINIFKTGLALFASLLMQCTAFAQPIVFIPASNPDIPWYSDGTYISSINTAMIDYFDTIDHHWGGISTLIVSDYAGNGMCGGVVFRDLVSGFTVQNIYTPGPFHMAKPDIIVGNDSINPLTDFRVAAAYSCSNLLLLTNQPQIDYYLVHYTGPGVFTVTFTGSTVFSGFSTNVGAFNVHIDIIAEAGNTAATGLPWCNKFVVTWDNFIMVGVSQIWAYGGRLNAPIIPMITPAAPAVLIGQGYQPDVAAIQRPVGAYCAACTPGTIDDLGLLTYTDIWTTQLFYAEYDFTAGMACFGPIAVSNPIPAGISMPRIDAPDDYTYNSPSTPFLSYYKVAAQIGVWPGVSSITFDNQTPFMIGANDASYYIASDIPYSPTVAFGGNNHTQYQVSHYINEYAALGGVPNVYMEPIDWMLPFVPNIPAIFPIPFTRPYFQINFNPILPNFVNGVNLNAISTPCNNPADQTLCTWSLFNITSGLSDVYYKTSLYNPSPGSNGYSYKHSKPALISNTTTPQWQVYPNPATVNIIVNNPSTQEGHYEVTDLLGRTVLQGNLQPNMQSIDIKSLMPGSYIINMYQGGERAYNSVFVKQ